MKLGTSCNTYDYLVKPVAIPDLINAVAKAIENHGRQQSKVQIELLLEHCNKKKQRRITIPTNEGLQFINPDDIVYLEASDNYTNIFLEPKRKFLVRRTLKSFEDSSRSKHLSAFTAGQSLIRYLLINTFGGRAARSLCVMAAYWMCPRERKQSFYKPWAIKCLVQTYLAGKAK